MTWARVCRKAACRIASTGSPARSRVSSDELDGRVTVSGLSIVDIDTEKNVLYIKGAVPGARNGLLLVSGPGEMELKAIKEESPDVKSGSRLDVGKEKPAEDSTPEKTEDKKEEEPKEDVEEVKEKEIKQENK